MMKLYETSVLFFFMMKRIILHLYESVQISLVNHDYPLVVSHYTLKFPVRREFTLFPFRFFGASFFDLFRLAWKIIVSPLFPKTFALGANVFKTLYRILYINVYGSESSLTFNPVISMFMVTAFMALSLSNPMVSLQDN